MTQNISKTIFPGPAGATFSPDLVQASAECQSLPPGQSTRSPGFSAVVTQLSGLLTTMVMPITWWSNGHCGDANSIIHPGQK